MRFLIFGDVVGKIGRRAVTKVLNELRKEYSPDSVIVNIENMAHGGGVTPETMKEAKEWAADVFTTGDHAWDNKLGIDLLESKDTNIIRPANYPKSAPGKGYFIYRKGVYQIAIINLQGQVFFKNHPDNPFYVLDRLLKQDDINKSNMIMVDFHADATSEKRAMGWYADGRVTAVWGTHQHVPTADAQILPKGTAYITDVGMNGGYESVLGVKKEGSFKTFLTQVKTRFEPVEEGQLEINALLVDVDNKTGEAINIAHIRKILKD